MRNRVIDPRSFIMGVGAGLIIMSTFTIAVMWVFG